MADSTGIPATVLGVWDYVVVLLLLLTSSSIGLYYRLTGGKQSTTTEFMLADGNMPFVPVAFSLMASFMSAITLLGVVQEMYMYGTMFIMINFAYIISTPIVCYFYLPVFYNLQKISVYKYLELRFGYATRLLASLSFSLQMTLYTGIVLYAPALALAAVTGLSESLSIALVGCVCTLYSALGGMKAVLITDVLQSLLMFAAVLIVLVTGLRTFSLSEVFLIAAESGRLEFFIVDPDPRTRHTLWTQIIGGSVTYLSLYAVNQAQVQRLLACRSLKESQRAVWLQWPILMTLSLSTALAGLIIYAQYSSCDPLMAGVIQNPDQLLPLYVVQYAGSTPGITGLFVAGVFSGSLSTVSSSLNSLSAVTIADYIQPLLTLCRGRPVRLSAYWSAALSVLYGLLCVGLAFVTASLGPGILQASLTVFGAVGGPLLGLFTLGMTTSSLSQKSAITGLVVGLSLSLWIGFGQPKPAPVYKPRYVDGCDSSLNLTEVPLNISSSSLFERLVFFDINSDANFSSNVDVLMNDWRSAHDTANFSNKNNDFKYSNLQPHSTSVFEPKKFDGSEAIKTIEGRQVSSGDGNRNYEDFAGAKRSLVQRVTSSSNATDDTEETESFNFLHELYAVSYAWIGTIGFLSTYLSAFVMHLVLRCAFGLPDQETDEMLLAPCFRRQRPQPPPDSKQNGVSCDKQDVLLACPATPERFSRSGVIESTKF